MMTTSAATRCNRQRMPDPSEILQRIYAAGFELQTFDRYPRAIGVSRGECIVLLEPEPAGNGLRMLGSPGWKLGDFMGVLTTQGQRQVFQFKSETVEATPDRLAELARFREEVEALMIGKPS
jgi:hypothetical protein